MILEWFTPHPKPTLEWFGQHSSILARLNRRTVSAVASVVGPPGQSAYALWLTQGNIGTEAEFLASLEASANLTPPDDILDYIAALDAALT